MYQKIKVYEEYVKASATLTLRLPGERAFRKIWQKYLPQLIITAPRSDLCWTCQKNSMAIAAASNKSDLEKMKVQSAIKLKIFYQNFTINGRSFKRLITICSVFVLHASSTKCCVIKVGSNWSKPFVEFCHKLLKYLHVFMMSCSI